MLNPSMGQALPPHYPAQDYGDLLARMDKVGMGAIGIRALAGGALSGTMARHPIASPPPEPIGSAGDYAADVANARAFRPLVAEGHAATLTEAAIRFATGNPRIATTLIGIATVAEFDAAAAAVGKGDLPLPALARLEALRAQISA
jgi:L-galactose dehydrogenase/L-glyceraldehyde 3-phosphate reductase